MATLESNSPDPAAVQGYLHGVGKYLVDRLYGSAGPAWGTRFADLEHLAHQLGQVVATQLLAQAVQRQADQPAPPDAELCPTCERPGQPCDPAPRDLATRDGPVHWAEPARFCTRCRRTFFPPIPAPRA